MATDLFISSRGGMFPFPQDFEKLLAPLPRSALAAMEIHAHPGEIPEDGFSSILSFWKSRRVALVRQTAYRGAYLPGLQKSWPETVLTAPAHLGPFSFLADLQADYFVVRQAREAETFLWKEKFSGDPEPRVAFREVEAWQESQEGLGVVDVDEVPWDRYDLVVCLDVPVPARITSQTPKTVWAYFSVEAGGPLHKISLARPVQGYHFYLNHAFRRFRVRPANRPHVVEFPFTFQSSAAWRALSGFVAGEGVVREGTVVDAASWRSSTGKHSADMTVLQGDAAAVIRLMASRRFAVRTDSRMRWGNWALEAVQSGCLFLGRADTLAMPGVLLPGLLVSDLPAAAERTRQLSENPHALGNFARRQTLIAEHLAFRRPLADLTRHVRARLGS